MANPPDLATMTMYIKYWFVKKIIESFRVVFHQAEFSARNDIFFCLLTPTLSTNWSLREGGGGGGEGVPSELSFCDNF